MVSAAAALLPRQALPGTSVQVLAQGTDGRLVVPEQHREQVRRLERSVVEVRAGAVVLRQRSGWRDGQASPPRSEVTAWSPRSRSRMVLALSSLDYAPLFAQGTPAMVTFTLPGDWLTVAPTGKAYKALIKAWRERYARAYGVRALGVWKLEFQARGAPHTHTFTVPPTTLALCFCEVCDLGYPPRLGYGTALPFRTWLSHSWADVVHHPDPAERAKHRAAGTGIDYREGLKARDPKRLAVYFSKHGGAAGGKEYQHHVPVEWQEPDAGPGRFWGVWGLSSVVEAVPVSDEDFRLMKRTLRRLSRKQSFYGDVASRYPTSVQKRTRKVRVPRGVNETTGEVRFRTVTRRREYLGNSMGGGFLLVNDGPALASALSRLEGLTA